MASRRRVPESVGAPFATRTICILEDETPELELWTKLTRIDYTARHSGLHTIESIRVGRLHEEGSDRGCPCRLCHALRRRTGAALRFAFHVEQGVCHTFFRKVDGVESPVNSATGNLRFAMDTCILLQGSPATVWPIQFQKRPQILLMATEHVLSAVLAVQDDAIQEGRRRTFEVAE